MAGLLSNLQSFAQGASNSAAETAGLPVDAIAWALRKLGVPIPEAPMGGTDWMKQKGLMREPENKTAGLLGDMTGTMAQIVVPMKSAQIAGGLLGMADNLAKPGPGPMGKQRGAINLTSERPDYVGVHTAPMKSDATAPLHDLTKIYPDDIYSSNAARYYGHYGDARDASAIRSMQAVKGKPDELVTIYRAVPNDPKIPSVINNGDWVTLSKKYAQEHGEGALNGNYKIISEKVPAKKLFTDANSIYEFGYDQSGKALPGLLGVLGGASAVPMFLKDDISLR